MLRTINEFALNLFAISTTSDLVWYVAREVVGRLGFIDCVIYLIEPDRALLRQVAAIGEKNPQGRDIVNALEIPVGQGITGRVAQRARPMIVGDLRKNEHYIPDIEPALSEICVPLIIDDRVVGVIDCEDPRLDHFGDEHLECLTTVAAMTSAKLKLIEEAVRIEEQSETLRRLNEQHRAESEERRRSLEALQRSEDRLQQAVELAGLGHWIWDAIEDRCLFCSEEHARLYGLSPDEYMARASGLEGSFSLTHPEDREAVRERFKTLCGGKGITTEYRTMGPQGEIRHVREVARPVFDQDGRVTKVVGTSIDISHHKQIEAEVRSRDVWLRAILENAPIQIALKDTEGRIMALSETVADYNNMTAGDAIGRKTSDLLPAAIAEIYEKADEEVLSTGRPIQQEVVEEHDGKTWRFLNAKFPLRDDEGQIIGICSLTNDITELKAAEAKLLKAQKMEALGQLTGGLAHDLNNLLAVIQGNAELLAARAREYASLADPILRASARGADLTQRLLAFARRQPLKPEAIDLAELASEVSQLLNRTLGETIELETRVDPDLWHALADPAQVENALLNLALNARDALPNGGKLTIEAANVPSDDGRAVEHGETPSSDYVVLVVSDTGIGMTPEILARAFEPFFTTKDVGQGSGLGLSMVYGFAKQSGGQVSIQSEAGQGTTVKLYLPRAERSAEPKARPPQHDLPRGRGERVLIIEDDPDLRALAARVLEGLGYRATAVPEAARAREILVAGEPIDLVLSDVVLPGGSSGPAFAEEARASHPDLKIIFMSGYPADAAKRNGFIGTDRVLLNKPFLISELATALREALD